MTRRTPGAIAASNISGGNWGAVVLQTTDLKTFDFATAQGYKSEVLTAPLQFGQCTAAWANTFDENYAAPGSVVQDPTLPAGNLIIVFEAEKMHGSHNLRAGDHIDLIATLPIDSRHGRRPNCDDGDPRTHSLPVVRGRPPPADRGRSGPWCPSCRA